MTAAFKIAAGVRTDFEELLRRFQKTKCVRFEEYAKVWREMKLSYIFSGHENGIELLTFTEECLNIALSYCLPPHSFQWRTGGLYLLYSIYFKQPNSPKVKIRITTTQWKEILNLMQEVVQQQHHDIHFVYWRLRQYNAFSFVAFPKQMAPYLKTKNDNDSSRCFLESSALKDMIDEDYCTPLEEIHQSYVNTKKELYPMDFSLTMVQEDLFSVLVKKIENFEKSRLKVVDGYLNELGEAEKKNDDDVGDSEDIGTRRRRLRKDQSSRKARTSQSRRHRAVEAESADLTPEKKKKTRRKMQKLQSQNKSSDEEMEVDEDVATRFSNEDGLMLSMPICWTKKTVEDCDILCKIFLNLGKSAVYKPLINLIDRFCDLKTFKYCKSFENVNFIHLNSMQYNFPNVEVNFPVI
uniref:snRNA-activating protein complex subunit 1 n=1 Tax=Strigamia maritima TaxID=126957 RepID=T1J8G1_STRMM